jgi:AbiV family abortive infection protein
MIERYERLAIQSYQNSQALLVEAIALLKEKSPRSLALAVFAAEEFGKAYLCKGYSCGVVSLKKVKRAFKAHDTKGVAYVRLLTSAFLFHKYVFPVVKARTDAGIRGPLTSEEAQINFAEGVPVSALLIRAWGHKNRALYVENADNASEPKESISLEETEALIDFLVRYTNGFEVILQQSDKGFVFTYERTSRINRGLSNYLRTHPLPKGRVTFRVERRRASTEITKREETLD